MFCDWDEWIRCDHFSTAENEVCSLHCLSIDIFLGEGLCEAFGFVLIFCVDWLIWQPLCIIFIQWRPFFNKIFFYIFLGIWYELMWVSQSKHCHKNIIQSLSCFCSEKWSQVNKKICEGRSVLAVKTLRPLSMFMFVFREASSLSTIAHQHYSSIRRHPMFLMNLEWLL